jgi:hypothetical protein
MNDNPTEKINEAAIITPHLIDFLKVMFKFRNILTRDYQVVFLRGLLINAANTFLIRLKLPKQPVRCDKFQRLLDPVS